MHSLDLLETTKRRAPVDQAMVRLLGPVRISTAQNIEIPLASRQQRGLAAVLASHAGQTLRPEYLGDCIGLTPGALRTAVSRLRRVVGENVITTEFGGYRLTATVDIDVFVNLVTDTTSPNRFERLTQALGMWQGEAIDEFRDDRWALAKVIKLDELRAGAVEDLACELLKRSRFSEAVALLEGHIALNPFRDRARGLLMRALAFDGRQVDALRAYQSYRQLLIEECGTEPSQDVRDLERRIATGSVPDVAVKTPPVSMQADPSAPSNHDSRSHGSRVRVDHCRVGRFGYARWWRSTATFPIPRF